MLANGCYVAITTPFLSDGSLDEAGLRANIKRILADGVAGIVPCGTTGETPTLSLQEQDRIITITLEECKGKCPVIAGGGSNSTAEAVKRTEQLMALGVDAILTVAPYYNKPTQRGLIAHFEAIAQVGLDMVLYNVPGRTASNILPATLSHLAKLPQVIAVKEASGSLEQVSEIARLCGDSIQIFSGDDALTLPMLALGASGVISVLGNVYPQPLIEMIDAWFDGDITKAQERNHYLTPLADSMFIEANPQPIKTIMNEFGYAAGGFRLPLLEMEDVNKQSLLAAFKNVPRS